MPDTNALREAYQAILLQELRGEITREERVARIIALRGSSYKRVGLRLGSGTP
jgi:hypothetical protein